MQYHKKESPPPLLNLQLYPNPMEQQKYQQHDKLHGIAQTIIDSNPNIQTTPFYTPIFPAPINLISSYNINANPFSGSLNIIYEDLLPKKELINSPFTTTERITTHNYIKAVLFNKIDEKHIDLSGNNNDLISHVRFMDLNPFNSYRFSNNPYKGLPDKTLLFRSCFPIRHSANMGILCAPDAMGINVKIYGITPEEYMVEDMKDLTYYDFNHWREKMYYDIIYEYIIKAKVCPNFTIMYGYYLTDKSHIDFNKIQQIKKKAVLNRTKNTSESIVPTISVPKRIDKTMQGGSYSLDYLMKNKDKMLGHSMILLTESPNYSLTGWASMIYQLNGIKRQMVNTGFHSVDIWYSIIFQIMAGLLTMQYNEIIFSEFNMYDNIYIKEQKTDSQKYYWIYSINNIDYYIPNYGYLVLIDAFFRDDYIINNVLPQEINEQKYNIYSTKFKYITNKINRRVVNIIIAQQFRTLFDRSKFGKDFESDGGVKPPEEILVMFDKIQNLFETYDPLNNDDFIEFVIFSVMRKFLNNRIGTFLKEIEYDNIDTNVNGTPKNGIIMVHEERNNTYKFVLIKKINDNNVEILSKDDNDKYIEIDVPRSSLYNYRKNIKIIQNVGENNLLYDDASLLEQYNIKNK